MAKKTKTIWAIKLVVSSMGWMEIADYFETRELAVQALPNYRDFYHTEPPKPDDRHIVPIEMVVEL